MRDLNYHQSIVSLTKQFLLIKWRKLKKTENQKVHKHIFVFK